MRIKYFLISVFFLLFLNCNNKAIAIRKDNNYIEDLSKNKFEDLHKQLDESKYLFLGNIDFYNNSKLPEELQGFIGRWEGYQQKTPVKNDIFIVIVFTEITKKYATAVISTGLDTLKPLVIEKREFKVIKNNNRYELQSETTIRTFNKGIIPVRLSFWIDNKTRKLFHLAENLNNTNEKSEYILAKDYNITVVKNKIEELKKHRITISLYADKKISNYSNGYMLYLPVDYEKDVNKKWPLILFYHGSGDIGDDPIVLYKASPFRYILDKEDLPCIIAAPQLKVSQYSFPDELLSIFLNELVKKYSIDTDRVYITGLSLGGYAAWQFVLSYPEKLAAVAPLSISLQNFNNVIKFQGAVNYKKLKEKPVWMINGVKDSIISIERARLTAKEARDAGMSVRFTELEDADHNTWTQTYSDRSFYEWLLSKKLKK